MFDARLRRVRVRHENPHADVVESVIDYHVPPEKFSDLAEYDGSVIVDRTAGEVSARCHDVEANSLALNLMHDIVTGAKSAEEARQYYAKDFLDYRRKLPTPYMKGLHFYSADKPATDPDTRILSDDASIKGRRRARAEADDARQKLMPPSR